MTSSAPSRPATPAAVSAAGPLSSWLEITPRTAWIAGAVFAAGFLLTFWDFLRNQAIEAVTQPSDWGHTLLIPAISGYFVWLKRDQLLAEPFRPSWWGIGVFVLGMSIYMLAAFGPPAVQHHNVRGLGAAIALLGGALAILGLRSFRYLWFPWAYWLVFGQTISQRLLSRVTERLQDWSAVGADILMNALGIDVERFGNVLTIHLSDGTSHPLNVAEACSGMRTLMAFLAIGVAMAALGLGTWWQRTALVVAGIPISLFVNILRVTSLGLLSIIDPNMSAGEFHSMVGLVWLVPAFLMFLGAMWVIRNLVVEEQATGDAP
ncbi:MAG: exosortase/archaeosortase family protein [Phycisphaerales bacterium]